MKKLFVVTFFALSSLSSFASEASADRCTVIAQKLSGKYNATLIKHNGDKVKAGKVSFTRISQSYTFKASNLQVIGDILLPGAPKKVALSPVAGECLMIGMGKIENNTFGSIIEGEDMRTFSVLVGDDNFESVSFVKTLK